MPSQNQNIGHNNVLTMSESFVSISHTGVTPINFIVSNPSCSLLVMLNYFDIC